MSIHESENPILSLYIEAHQAALKHKWHESQKYSRDMGEEAIRDWYRRFWIPFCKHKRIEHLCGRSCWEEFEEDGFGGLNTLILEGDLMLDRILDQLACGLENLEILNWAIDWNLDADRVIDILEMININCAKLEPQIA